MKDFVPRSFSEVATQIIDVIKDKCTFPTEEKEEIIGYIKGCINDSGFRAPELAYMDWENLSGILSQYFVPSNSKWETEIMVIFNDLNGTVNDYWDDERGELKNV